jgi:hypothetical protein
MTNHKCQAVRNTRDDTGQLYDIYLPEGAPLPGLYAYRGVKIERDHDTGGLDYSGRAVTDRGYWKVHGLGLHREEYNSLKAARAAVDTATPLHPLNPDAFDDDGDLRDPICINRGLRDERFA